MGALLDAPTLPDPRLGAVRSLVQYSRPDWLGESGTSRRIATRPHGYCGFAGLPRSERGGPSSPIGPLLGPLVAEW
jgi:hypothetical protein